MSSVRVVQRTESLNSLRSQAQELEAQLKAIQQKIVSLENASQDLHHQGSSINVPSTSVSTQDETQRNGTHVNGDAKESAKTWEGTGHTMSKEEVERYSRQILLHSFGPQAQDKLCKGSVLIIGAGGLGCPAAIYLAAAGIGKIGIVDKDTVELSNLHRQILHSEQSVGRHKAESAANACRAINSLIQVIEHRDGFHPGNALQLVKDYDVVLDASDNAPTRYLISDACCVLGKPLVSGAAIGTDGQLNVYCHNKGPCYRCLFPVPPSAGNCSRCSDAGVLGPVPGLIGILQALETIKIISGVGTVSSQKMLMVDTLSGRFTSVKLRGRQADCVSCGDNPSITAETLPEFSYRDFTGQDYNDSAPESLRILSEDERLSPTKFAAAMKDSKVIDVRPQLQYDAAHLPGAINLPLDEFHPDKFEKAISSEINDTSQQLLVMCRRGNNSQRAVEILSRKFGIEAMDLIGGMQEWTELDSSFPYL